jgi:hypothetical protein
VNWLPITLTALCAAIAVWCVRTTARYQRQAEAAEERTRAAVIRAVTTIRDAKTRQQHPDD